jgi:hypothetical protein
MERKVRDREDPLVSTRDARASKQIWQARRMRYFTSTSIGSR